MTGAEPNHARRLGPDVMPDDAYAAMVLVVLGSCLITLLRGCVRCG